MAKEGIETILALEPDRGPVSEEEAEELLEFFCGPIANNEEEPVDKEKNNGK